MRRLKGLMPAIGLAAACLAVAAGSLPTGARAEAEMTFRAVRIGGRGMCDAECPTVIAATGQITRDTPARFLQFVASSYDRSELHAVVFLDSPGGGVLASMKFGSLLRQIGAAAVIARVYSDGQGGSVMTNAQCFSACVYALIGARKRVVPVGSQIGIHRMFANDDTLDASGLTVTRRRLYDNGDMGAMLKSYSAQMGVSPGLITAAEHVPSDQLRILSRAEIRRYRLGVPHL